MMKISLGLAGVFLLMMISFSVNGGKIVVSGAGKPPPVLEVIQLLQLDTIKQLKKTIKDIEDTNEELERRTFIVEQYFLYNEQHKTQMMEDLERKIKDLEKEIVEIKEERTHKLYEAQTEFSCMAPWTQLSTGCYRFNEQAMTWSEAQQFCNNTQAKLVEIDSAEENLAILEEIKKQGYKGKKMEFWLGLTDLEKEGDWMLASTGERPAYTNWAEDEPNDHGGGEDCAYLNIRDVFNDIPCDAASYKAYSFNALCETL